MKFEHLAFAACFSTTPNPLLRRGGDLRAVLRARGQFTSTVSNLLRRGGDPHAVLLLPPAYHVPACTGISPHLAACAWHLAAPAARQRVHVSTGVHCPIAYPPCQVCLYGLGDSAQDPRVPTGLGRLEARNSMRMSQVLKGGLAPRKGSTTRSRGVKAHGEGEGEIPSPEGADHSP